MKKGYLFTIIAAMLILAVTSFTGCDNQPSTAGSNDSTLTTMPVDSSQVDTTAVDTTLIN